MLITVTVLLAIAAALIWWVRDRSARLRHEAESREAQMLDALFAARRSAAGNGGETIDLDKVFGGGAAASERATSTDAVLRAAGLEAGVIALVRSPPPATTAPAASAGSAATPASAASRPSQPASAPSVGVDTVPRGRPRSEPRRAEVSVQVRDLVQVFYEARGYRPVPAARVALPIELVLRHRSDPLRSYAFAPLAERVTEPVARAMLERARRIDQSRVLIAAEGGVAPELANALLTQGVRVLDSAAIEAQLAQLDLPTAAKVRAVARQRASRRAYATLS
jgi:hypothetical protein